MPQALLINGPKRSDWRMVTVADDEEAGAEDMEKHIGGPFELTYVVTGLAVYNHGEGMRLFPPYVRAVQSKPNPHYPGGAMIFHGPVLIFRWDGHDDTHQDVTPITVALVETVFIPVERDTP